MNKTKQFALYVGAAAMLIGTSAFAESRHTHATERGGSGDRGGRTNVERRNTEQRSTTPSYQQQRTETRNWNNNNQNRSYDRNNNYNNRNNTRSYESNRGYTQQRSYDNRSYDRNRGSDNRSFDRNRGYSGARGNAYYRDGRISRIEHWNGGYRVWLGGVSY
ncbi:MAG TPA: hypothetical protein VGJ82_02120, partial [Thermoanaerobaculia bacterium]